MIPALHVLCAKLGVVAYGLDYLHPVVPDLGPWARVFRQWIWGDDGKGVGVVAFGFVSDGPEGNIATIRGTQTPDGSMVEWLDDFDAILEPCPFVIGANWHRGFGRVYRTLRAGPDASASQFLAAYLSSIKSPVVSGHSLGGPLATYAAIEGHGRELVLFASPKPGDSYLAKAAASGIETMTAYVNPNDAVPRLPITVDWPFKLEDFEHVVEATVLKPDLVTPPIPGDWSSSHNLSNYLRLLEAAT